MKKQMWSAGLAAMFAAGLILVAPMDTWAAEPVADGVYAGSLNLSGLTEQEASDQIDQYIEEKLNQKIILDINGAEAETDGAALGSTCENRDAIQTGLKETVLKGNLIKRYKKQKDLEENPVDLSPEFSMDEDKVNDFLSEHCGAAVSKAQDATIERKDGTFVITPEQEGVTVDLDATKAAFNEALNGETSGEVRVEASVTVDNPKVTEADLSTIKDVLGTFSTSFASSGASRSTNLAVGAGKINGHVLMPGETLSGYECMQPFTVENGYRTATAYQNGHSVDSVGGGVCQISTTLYNASLFAELTIVQRQNHSMSVGYVKPSMDAAIAGTYKDLKIQNPYDTPIYIEGYTKGKTLTFTIYGKETRPANRTLSFESETLSTTDAGVQEIVDASLAPGQRVKVESGHTGIKSRLYKCVYVDGTLQERTLLNDDTYNASKTVYRVGPAAAAASSETPAETPAQTQAPPVETESAATEAPAETAAPETAAQTQAPETTAPAAGENYGPGMSDPAGADAA